MQSQSPILGPLCVTVVLAPLGELSQYIALVITVISQVYSVYASLLPFDISILAEVNMIVLQVPLPPTWLDPIAFLINLFWTLARSFATFVICFGIGLVGIKVLDLLTPGIRELRNIKGKPLPTALFALGMFIFLSLTFLGSATAPLPIGVSSGLGAKVSPWVVLSYRMIALLAGFVISLLFAFVFDRVLSSLKPFGIDLDDVNKSHEATGIYVMGYVIFLGVILYASLLLPV